MNDARDLLRDLWRSGVTVHLLPDRFRLDPTGAAPQPLKGALGEYRAEVRAALRHLPAPDRCQVCGEVTRGSAGNRGRIHCVTCALIAAAFGSHYGSVKVGEHLGDPVIIASCSPLDPRPDLTEDTELWESFLADSRAEDGHDPVGLYGPLHGLRALGARLESQGDSLRLDRGEIEPASYATKRARYLVGHSDRLVRLLRHAAAKPER